MPLEVIDHGGPALELRLSHRPELFDRVAAWYVRPGILVDSGGARTIRELAAWLEGRPVEAALLGHWHEDHSAGAAELARRRIPVLGSRSTAARLRRPARIPPYRDALWGQIEPVRVLPAEGAPLRPVPLPGHSPDQLGYLDEESGWLFSGDLALRRRQTVSMPGEDPWAMIESLRRALALGPAALATSHRSLVANPQPFLRENLDYLEDLAGRVAAAHQRGLGPRAIVRELFGGEPLTQWAPVSWRQHSGGEFSAERWVRAFLRGL